MNIQFCFQLFIDKTERRISQGGSSEGGGDNECDFFDHDSHKNEVTANDLTTHKLSRIKNGALSKTEDEDGAAPSVEAALSMSPSQAQESLGVRKPTIGQRKPAKKAGVSTLARSQYKYCM